MVKEDELLLARARAYQLFSVAFANPSPAFASVLENGEFDGIMSRAFGGNKYEPVGRCELEELASQHRFIFGHSLSKDCPPYETQYGSSHIFMQSNELADISGFYKAFGLDVADNAHERCDHISIELEFMGFLVFKTLHALKFGSADKADICREAQQKFYKEHLGQWMPVFIARLNQKYPGTFYARLALRLKGFLAVEANNLEVNMSELRPMDLSPLSFEPDTDCFNCDLTNVCEQFGNSEEGNV